MGRGGRRGGGGGGGGLFGGSRSKAPAKRPAAAPPATQQSGGGGGMMSGLMGTMVQGAAWGVGTSMAHRAVDGVIGGREVTVKHEDGSTGEVPGQDMGMASQAAPAQQFDACQLDKQNFFDCLKATGGDSQACSSLQEMMKSCQLMSGSGGGSSFN